MKLKGSSNSIKGLYNHSFLPIGAVYTEGDLVYHDKVLYTCLLETNTDPNSSNPEWEYYLNSLSPIKDYSSFEEINNNNKIVTANVLREYLQKSFPGTNPGGELKVIADGKLSDLIINSKFQLDTTYLTDLKETNPEEVPVDPKSDRLYILTVYSGTLESGDIIRTQELAEINSTGDTSIWYRSGKELGSSNWSTLDLNLSMGNYKTYLENLALKYTSSINLIEGFLEDINEGEYNMWRSLAKENFKLSNRTLKFSREITNNTHSIYKHYKIYYSSRIGGVKHRGSIEINPSDHTILEGTEVLRFKDLSGAELSKDGAEYKLSLPNTASVLAILESNQFSL